MAVKLGITTIAVTAPDGSAAAVKVTVEYSFTQWLCLVFLAGWAWMSYTSAGPFDLGREIIRLREFGIGDGLMTLFMDKIAGFIMPMLVGLRELFAPGWNNMHQLYSDAEPQKILILGNSFIWTSGIGNALQNLLGYNERELIVDAVGIGMAEVSTFLEYSGLDTGEYDAVFICGFYGSGYKSLQGVMDLAKGTDTQFVIFPAPNEQPYDAALAWVGNQGANYLGWYDLVHYLWDEKGFAFEELAYNDYHSHSNEAAGYLAAMAVYTYLYGVLPEHSAGDNLFEVPSAWAGLTEEQLFAKMQAMRGAVKDMVLNGSVKYAKEFF
jgi:hypothetical protein